MVERDQVNSYGIGYIHRKTRAHTAFNNRATTNSAKQNMRCNNASKGALGNSIEKTIANSNK